MSASLYWSGDNGEEHRLHGNDCPLRSFLRKQKNGLDRSDDVVLTEEEDYEDICKFARELPNDKWWVRAKSATYELASELTCNKYVSVWESY